MRCKAPARLCDVFCIPDSKLTGQQTYIKQTCKAKTGAFLALWRCDAQSMQKPPAVRPAGG